MSNLLLVNAKIYTFDRTHPRATAILFVNGRVAAFDDDALAMKNSQTEVVDLRGLTVLPGFIDHHLHFTGFAIGLARVNLEGAKSIDEAARRVDERVKISKPGDWIFGRGWNHLDWEKPEFPSKSQLDAVSPSNPVALTRKDGHSMWLNSAALDALRVNRDTANPDGGLIERDAAGEPTGLLREKAMTLVSGNIGFEVDEISESELLASIHHAHRAGLTGIHNVEGANALRAFQDLNAKNKLKLRVLHMIPADNLDHALALGLQTGLGDDWLRIGGVKIFSDGSLGSQTAWMLEPFEGTKNCGVPVTPPEKIESLAREASRAKLMVITHAIGDRANREVLNVYEKLRRESFSNVLRIEHAQHLHPTDIPRFHTLNVVASMQPIHATSDYKMADQFLGSRARYAYSFRSLLDSSAKLVFGSDCPVETLDPLVGIHAAVTRERSSGDPRGGWYPDQKLSVEQAVRAYTSPLISFPGKRRVEDEVGAPADIVVLSRDIFSILPSEILSTRVEYTIVGGEIVYAAPDENRN
jgi:predicted amidohydrolase YtcJ